MAETQINQNQIADGETIKVANFLINGSLSQVAEGQYTNFTTDNYITLTNKVIDGTLTLQNSYSSMNIARLGTADTWEIRIKIKTDTIPSSGSLPIFGQQSSNHTTPQMEIYNGYINFCLSMTGDSWTYDITSETYRIQDNTDYYVQMAFSGEKYKCELLDINKNVLDSIEVTDNRKVYSLGTPSIGKDEDASFSNGIIDLTETYIKVNGEIWWQPYIEVPVGQVTINI